MRRGRGSAEHLARAAAFTVTLAAAAASPTALAYDGPVASGAAVAVGDAGSEVVFRALSLLGVSYRFGGNTPETGLDCSGLVRLVFNDTLGLPLPRRSEEISRVGSEIDPSELQPGDLVFFNTLRRAFSHVGIYIGNNQFVHAPSTGRTIRVENLGADYWTRRFDGARRLLSQDLLAAASMNPVAATTARVMHASAARVAAPPALSSTGAFAAAPFSADAPVRPATEPALPASAASRAATDGTPAPRGAPTVAAAARPAAAPGSGPARATTVALRPSATAPRAAATRPRPAATRAAAKPAAKPAAQRVVAGTRLGDLYVN